MPKVESHALLLCAYQLHNGISLLNKRLRNKVKFYATKMQLLHFCKSINMFPLVNSEACKNGDRVKWTLWCSFLSSISGTYAPYYSCYRYIHVRIRCQLVQRILVEYEPSILCINFGFISDLQPLLSKSPLDRTSSTTSPSAWWSWRWTCPHTSSGLLGESSQGWPRPPSRDCRGTGTSTGKLKSKVILHFCQLQNKRYGRVYERFKTVLSNLKHLYSSIKSMWISEHWLGCDQVIQINATIVHFLASASFTAW